MARLPDTISTVDSLSILCRIPTWIEDDNTICSCEIDTIATCFRCEQADVGAGIRYVPCAMIELINDSLSISARATPIDTKGRDAVLYMLAANLVWTNVERYRKHRVPARTRWMISNINFDWEKTNMRCLSRSRRRHILSKTRSLTEP
jgi:predicted nucleic acid binding AN1-type Zn finger protein